VKDPPEMRTVEVNCRGQCHDEHDAGDKEGAACDHAGQDNQGVLNGT
jgi:hypothetical protein